MRNLLLALFVIAIVLVPNCAHAQHQPRVSPHLILARMCAHEASLPVLVDGEWRQTRHHDLAWGADCWIIHTVILRGAHRIQQDHPEMSLPRAYVISAQNYSHGRIIHPPATDGNRWAADLRPDGRPPVGWHGLPWSHMRASWLHVYEVTDAIVRTPLEALDGGLTPLHCDGRVDDWGGRMDREHAAAIGLIELHCEGNPVNFAYRRP